MASKLALTDLCTKVNFRMIYSTAKASSFTRMASQATRVRGSMGKCTERACTIGRMGVATRASTSSTKKMASVSTCGPMDVHTTACGRTETRMARAPKLWQTWI